MLKIRLKRLGRKKKACYRIVIMDSRNKRDGKALEEIGFYNPLTKQSKINIEKVENRIKQGAQLSKTVKYIIKQNYNE